MCTSNETSFMRSWQHSSSGPIAIAEATDKTILVVKSFCEMSSMDSDITNRDIAHAHIYQKLKYTNKGHMNEKNPKPSIPRVLAIRRLDTVNMYYEV
jgi:hypothetical protein